MSPSSAVARCPLAVIGPTVALVALAALAFLPAPARAEPPPDLALKALREDSSLKVRAQAALVLGQRRAPEAVPALREALARDAAAVVRMAAASALGRIGDPSAVPSLAQATRSDADPGVRAAAARALDALAPAPAAVGRLVTLDEPTGDAGGAAARQALRGALEKHLRANGFELAGRAGTGPDPAALRLKPSVVRVTVERASGGTVVAVTASLVAIARDGRVAAMLEGSARLRATGSPSAEAVAGYEARALDAAARTLGEDLAARVPGR